MSSQSAISPSDQDRIRKALFDGLKPVDAPKIYAMAGIPGAGKTTFVTQARQSGLFPARAFILNPDNVMGMIGQYRRDHKKNAADAFMRWEMPARAFAYELAYEAVSQRLPIIKDMGMARVENWRMLQGFKIHYGYTVEVHAIHCPVPLALAAIRTRDRFFPEEQVRARDAALGALFMEYAYVPDNVFWYERAGHEYRAIKNWPST